ncbi:MAG: NAD-dependent epimerase/dehydratase family protein, partial [Thermodesulfobacteriota bacterium]
MSKNILITGAAGFVGTYLTELLIDKGYDVIILSRSAKNAKANIAHWDPETGEIDVDALQNLDAVVHLAGESIVGRWTDQKKARIENSRVLGT